MYNYYRQVYQVPANVSPNAFQNQYNYIPVNENPNGFQYQHNNYMHPNVNPNGFQNQHPAYLPPHPHQNNFQTPHHIPYHHPGNPQRFVQSEAARLALWKSSNVPLPEVLPEGPSHVHVEAHDRQPIFVPAGMTETRKNKEKHEYHKRVVRPTCDRYTQTTVSCFPMRSKTPVAKPPVVNSQTFTPSLAGSSIYVPIVRNGVEINHGSIYGPIARPIARAESSRDSVFSGFQRGLENSGSEYSLSSESTVVCQTQRAKLPVQEERAKLPVKEERAKDPIPNRPTIESLEKKSVLAYQEAIQRMERNTNRRKAIRKMVNKIMANISMKSHHSSS